MCPINVIQLVWILPILNHEIPFALLAERQHRILLESLDVFALYPLVHHLNLLHCLLSLQLELTVVKVDQLVAQTVHVFAEAALPRQHILIVVYVFEDERPVAKHVLCEVDLELVFCETLTDRVWLVWFVGFGQGPEFAAQLVTNARTDTQFVIALKLDLYSVDSLVLVD